MFKDHGISKKETLLKHIENTLFFKNNILPEKLPGTPDFLDSLKALIISDSDMADESEVKQYWKAACQANLFKR